MFKTTIKFGFLCLLAVVHSCLATASPRAYVCEVRQVYVITDKGKVGKSDWTKIASSGLKEFTFSESEGILRWTGAEAEEKFEVRQFGTDHNGMVAVEVGYGERPVIYDVLRIRTFQESWVFSLNNTFHNITGVCR